MTTVGAICIALLLVFAPSLLQNLPNTAPGAVVIAACISLVDIQGVVRLYQLRRSEFDFSIACFLGVALIGVIQGIFRAIALALARKFQPGSAYTFALPGAGIHLKPGTFTVDKPAA